MPSRSSHSIRHCDGARVGRRCPYSWHTCDHREIIERGLGASNSRRSRKGGARTWGREGLCCECYLISHYSTRGYTDRSQLTGVFQLGVWGLSESIDGYLPHSWPG